MDALVEAGIKVQLDHDEKETNFQDHGWIKICHDTGEGSSKVIVESAMFQHNRNYQARLEMIPDLVEQVLAHCNASVPKENKGPENIDAEAKPSKPSKQLSKEKRVSVADEPGSPMKKTRGANNKV